MQNEGFSSFDPKLRVGTNICVVLTRCDSNQEKAGTQLTPKCLVKCAKLKDSSQIYMEDCTGILNKSSAYATSIKHKTIGRKFPRRRHFCNFCDKRFSSKNYLNRHIQIHTGDIKFACSICQKVCTNPSALKKHMLTHSADSAKKYICKICPKRYTSNTRLERHIISHLREKPYICKECGKSYSDKCSLDNHMLVHLA